MTPFDQPDLAAASEPAVAPMPAGGALPAPLLHRLRDDLDALCREAHDDALERLVEDGRALCPNRAVQLAVYRSLRWLRSGEPSLRARFAAHLGGGVETSGPDAIGLLDADDLREGLAHATFAAQAQGIAGAPFAVLARSLREAGVDAAAVAALAPRALLQAYVAALDEFTLDVEVRLELSRALQARLLAALPACYREWHCVLRDGSAPPLDTATSPTPPPPPPAATWPRAAVLRAIAELHAARHAGAMPFTAGSPRTIMALLQADGGHAGSGAVHPGGMPVASGASSAHGSQVSVGVTRARGSQVPTDAPSAYGSQVLFDVAQAGDTALAADVPLAHRLEAALLAANGPARFAQADRAAIELVDILFAMLVADPGFPPSLAADFLALRLPFLALCLQDRAHVLMRSSAPRRLLESLVRGVLGADPAQPSGRHALACARATIDAAAARRELDASICARLRADFEHALAAAPAADDADVPRERMLQAWQAVAASIGRELARTDLPPLVHALLRRPWAQSMLRVALRHGEDSPEFRHAAGIAAALCAAFADWGTRPSLQPQHSQRAMHGLAAIAIDLRAGLERAGHGAFEVVELWQHLTRLIVQPVRDDERPEPHLPMLFAGLDIDSALREYAPPAAPVAAAAATLPPAALRVGQIVDWHAPDRATQRLKLCWRSALSGWHVFVNAAGVKTLELPAARVARLLADGQLELKDTP